MASDSFVENLVVLYASYKEVVSKIFPNLNVVGHLAVPAVWGSCLPRLAIFYFFANFGINQQAVSSVYFQVL